MGSMGSYNASVSLEYTTKTKIENTDEQILAFLKKKKVFYAAPMEGLENWELEDIKECFDSDEDIESKRLLVKISDEKDEYILGYEEFEEYYEDEYIEIETVSLLNKITEEDLKPLRFYNLGLLSAQHIRYLVKTACITVASVYEDIYCDNDNSSEEEIKFSKQQLEDIMTGKCKVVLSGDGSGYC